MASPEDHSMRPVPSLSCFRKSFRVIRALAVLQKSLEDAKLSRALVLWVQLGPRRRAPDPRGPLRRRSPRWSDHDSSSKLLRRLHPTGPTAYPTLFRLGPGTSPFARLRGLVVSVIVLRHRRNLPECRARMAAHTQRLRGLAESRREVSLR